MSDRTFEYLLNAMEHAAHSANPFSEGYAEKRKAVFNYVAERDHRIATLEAELADWRRNAWKIHRAVGNVCLAFHDWPEYTGSEYCQAERKNAINDLAEAVSVPLSGSL